MDKVELGQIENLYKQYEAWCHSQGLFPNGLSVEFFDWMNANG